MPTVVSRLSCLVHGLLGGGTELEEVGSKQSAARVFEEAAVSHPGRRWSEHGIVGSSGVRY